MEIIQLARLSLEYSGKEYSGFRGFGLKLKRSDSLPDVFNQQWNFQVETEGEEKRRVSSRYFSTRNFLSKHWEEPATSTEQGNLELDGIALPV